MWLYEGKEIDDGDTEGYVGFVYRIDNTTTGKYYIGKKNFTFKKRYQKNKRKRIRLVESDWREYTGSNEELNEHIDRGDQVVRTVLRLCKTRGEMSYYEAKYQFIDDVLLDEKSYNKWIMVKIRRSHLRNGK